ncbi:MAG: hypothetical protein ABEJ26_11090 [Halosimplex sp.]
MARFSTFVLLALGWSASSRRIIFSEPTSSIDSSAYGPVPASSSSVPPFFAIRSSPTRSLFSSSVMLVTRSVELASRYRWRYGSVKSGCNGGSPSTGPAYADGIGSAVGFGFCAGTEPLSVHWWSVHCSSASWLNVASSVNLLPPWK